MAIFSSGRGAICRSKNSGIWTYPLPTSYTSRGAFLPDNSGWDAFDWYGSQTFVPVGGTLYAFYVAGDAYNVDDYAEHAKMGAATTTDGITWSFSGSNPLASFSPGGAGNANPTEEGYFGNAVYLPRSGIFTQVFGGATGIDATQVKINIYQQTSTSPTTSWSPNTSGGSSLVVAYNTATWVHTAGGNDEIFPSGLWYDEVNSLWHMIYIQKTDPAKDWSLSHVSGADLGSLSGANSNAFLAVSSNPLEASGQYRGGVIIERGQGVVDVVVSALNIAGTSHAICRVPVLPDYSWTSPGPIEVLYYMNADFSITGWAAGMMCVWPQKSMVVMDHSNHGVSTTSGIIETAPTTRTSDGKLSYTPSSSARFTGASDQSVVKTSILTGQASSTKVSGSFAFNLASLSVDQTPLRFETSGGAYRFEIFLFADGTIGFIARNSGGTQIISLNSAIGVFTATTQYCLMWSFDMTSYSNSKLYLNNTDIKPVSAGTWTNASIDFTNASRIVIGHESTGVQPLDGSLTDMGLVIGTTFDFSSTPIRRRWVTANNELQNPGTDGRLLWGIKPILFLTGNGSGFLTNLGSGGGSFSGSTLTNGSGFTGHP